jgi:uncharacterized SAM-binding protein YcdF (DUF218 family)
MIWLPGLVLTAAMLVELAYWCLAAEVPADAAPPCAVLVLGYPSKADGSPHPIQRFRVEAGIRVMHEQSCNRMVVSGGAAANRYVEADSMAEIAKSLGVAEGALVREPTARTTLENIGCSAPYLQDFERIFIVSDTLHARRGKRYACRLGTSLCARTIAAGSEPPLALLGWKLLAAIHELAAALLDYSSELTGLPDRTPVCGTRSP